MGGDFLTLSGWWSFKCRDFLPIWGKGKTLYEMAHVDHVDSPISGRQCAILLGSESAVFYSFSDHSKSLESSNLYFCLFLDIYK